jgi:hypothetical protein
VRFTTPIYARRGTIASVLQRGDIGTATDWQKLSPELARRKCRAYRLGASGRPYSDRVVMPEVRTPLSSRSIAGL